MFRKKFIRNLLNQGFSTGAALGPLWGPRSGSPGATSRGLYEIALPWYCKTQNKDRYFYWWAGGQKCWESLEGGHKSWKFENHCSKRWALTPCGGVTIRFCELAQWRNQKCYFAIVKPLTVRETFGIGAVANSKSILVQFLSDFSGSLPLWHHKAIFTSLPQQLLRKNSLTSNRSQTDGAVEHMQI